MPERIPDLNFSQQDIRSLAQQLLDLGLDPAPRLRVLRDLLGCSPADHAFREAARNLSESRWVRELAAFQLPDGTWGRFHTQDTRVKSPIPTSEFAIRRALALGLDQSSPMLQKAAGVIQAHLEGKTTWADPPEKHDDPRVFPHNIRFVSAGMLALIDRRQPLLDPLWLHWADLLEAALASGSYDPQAELARHRALSGITSKRLFAFHVYYPLLILSATRQRLPQDLEHRMLAFLLHKPDGIYYIYNQGLDNLPRLDDWHFQGWLNGHEILARFEEWKDFAPAILNWLWSQRNEGGLWDPGNRAGHSFALPLSESWRQPGNRMIDCSVRILCLLQRYFEYPS